MANKEPVAWITVNGVHVPIFDGQTKEEAIKSHLAKRAYNEEASKEKQLAQSKKEAEQKNAEKEAPKYKDATTYKEFEKANFELIKNELMTTDKDLDDIKEEWYSLRHDTKVKDLHEMTYDEIQNAGSAFRQSAYEGWFRSANSDYKPELAHSLFSDENELNIGMSIAYFHYRINHDEYSFLYDKWRTNNAMSFKEWLDTPMTLYRGHRGQQSVKSDVFIAYTPDKKVAEKFGNNIETIQITPRETWGSYNLTGEAEYWIPSKWLKEKKK